MRIDAAIEYADQLLYERTGRHLNDLQSRIIQQSWQGQTYSQVARTAGYSEGHIKDVAAQLWKLLSEALGERITKGNLRARLINRLKRTVKSTIKSTVKSATPSSLHPLMSSSATKVAAAMHFEWGLTDVSAERVEGSTQYFTADYLTAGYLTANYFTADFIGREQALIALHSLAQAHRIMVIQGEGGIGKTTLAQRYCQRFDLLLALPMAKESANITPAESIVEEWLRQHFNEEPGREFGVTLSRFKQRLDQQTARHQAEGGSRVGVLIDNLEPALDGNGQFIAAHRGYVELLRVLSSSQATVIMTSRDRLCEPSIKAHHYRLLGLTVESWQQFFAAGGTAPVEQSILSKMHRAYGGNAKAMEILQAAVIEDFEGDLSAYWQENGSELLGPTELRNLVASQINRLQQLDADAYRVFCRLGCYRYQQPQPRLGAEAIAAVMWDIEPSRHRQTLNSLRDRSLLEFRKGEYWLHPVSRAEAIARLRQSSDSWQQANQAAAQYWSDRITSVVSVEDGLQALEAYYHLMAAKDYDGAAAVLLQSRHNQWQQFLPLASSLYRMGLLQPVVSAIVQVLPFIEKKQSEKSQQQRSELNNILGDVYWITGRVHSAIACQRQTLSAMAGDSHGDCTEDAIDTTEPLTSADSTADSTADLNAYYRKMLIVDAHLSIGLYAIDLWELSQAAEQFEQVIVLAAGTAHQAWADKATVGLALVRAYLAHTAKTTAESTAQTQAANELANSLYEQFTTAEQPGRYAYFVQLLGQAFSSLGELDKAQVLYERAIAFAEASQYVQVKAQAIKGLATLQRQRGKVDEAIALHTQAVELSETIGAKCDLAEAYFQFGLSVGANGKIKQTDYFERAIALFREIQAPQQVDRIKQAHRSMASQL